MASFDDALYCVYADMVDGSKKFKIILTKYGSYADVIRNTWMVP